MKQALAQALEARGYDTLTPVQEAVLNPDLSGRDLLVSAQTGSGKTLGFGLAIAPTLLGEAESFPPAGAPLALVIAPTRELAMQVKRELAWLYAGAGAVLASTVGGMDMRDERRTLDRGAHVVVATPGRLRDHITRGSIDLSSLRAVVLDEADEMLDLGFREDLEFILGQSPEDRQTLLFSATVPAAIAKLAQSYQRDAARVATVTGERQHADIEYQAVSVGPRDAENAIINVLRFHESPNAIVFCNTRAMVNRLTTRLSNRGFPVVALSGELSQAERTHALQAMRDGRARVCVATDVAARGIDLPNLDLVIHAELPTGSDTLLHRSGRTGRAGRKGVSVLIVPPAARTKANRLLGWAKLSAEWMPAPSADAVLEKDRERMMADLGQAEPVTESEAPAVAALTGAFAPEQLAAAYLRVLADRRSAPEDLAPVDPKAAPEKRADFGPSRWFTVDAGRATGMDARRLLPVLCKAGGLTRDDIGAIRLRDGESFFQIREGAAEGFLQRLGPDMRVEDMTVRPSDGPPAGSKPEGRFAAKSSGKPAGKPAGKRPARRDDEAPPPSKWIDTPADTAPRPAKKPRHKPRAPERPEGVVEPFRKSKGKKPAKGPGKAKFGGVKPGKGKPGKG
ncbi:DEAD/DEAH box helicase [Jannaschia rubra]|uniref:DEAD/DEAH box helicase n=1 Tax=Jannaschia rubra TaxID=282197 RepID=UPI0024924326|nr:DEAD/DEAH box helicase [Jannaschia rubra]